LAAVDVVVDPMVDQVKCLCPVLEWQSGRQRESKSPRIQGWREEAGTLVPVGQSVIGPGLVRSIHFVGTD